MRALAVPAVAAGLMFLVAGSTNPFILQTRTGVVVYAVNTGTTFSYNDGQTWVPQDLTCGSESCKAVWLRRCNPPDPRRPLP